MADLLQYQKGGSQSSLTHSDDRNSGDWGSLNILNDACFPSRFVLTGKKLAPRIVDFG